MKNTEILHQEINAFLPAVYEKLKALTREEIIQLFISAEFNRFLQYYQHAPDINVELKRDGGRVTSGAVRLFVNLGQMERFNDRRLKAYLLNTAGIPNLHIANIDVQRMYSFFEADAQCADVLMAKFKKEKFRNRRVQIEFADQRQRKNKGKREHSGTGVSYFSKKKKRRFGR